MKPWKYVVDHADQTAPIRHHDLAHANHIPGTWYAPGFISAVHYTGHDMGYDRSNM